MCARGAGRQNADATHHPAHFRREGCNLCLAGQPVLRTAALEEDSQTSTRQRITRRTGTPWTGTRQTLAGMPDAGFDTMMVSRRGALTCDKPLVRAGDTPHHELV